MKTLIILTSIFFILILGILIYILYSHSKALEPFSFITQYNKDTSLNILIIPPTKTTLTKYSVYYDTNSNFSTAKIISSTNSASFLLKNLLAANTYYIRSRIFANTENEYSSFTTTVIPQNVTPLSLIKLSYLEISTNSYQLIANYSIPPNLQILNIQAWVNFAKEPVSLTNSSFNLNCLNSPCSAKFPELTEQNFVGFPKGTYTVALTWTSEFTSTLSSIVSPFSNMMTIKIE